MRQGRLDRLKPSRSRLAGWESGCFSNFVQRPVCYSVVAVLCFAAFRLSPSKSSIYSSIVIKYCAISIADVIVLTIDSFFWFLGGYINTAYIKYTQYVVLNRV